jgi:hypothetical protein
MIEDLPERCLRIGEKLDLDVRTEQIEYTAPVRFDPGCVESICRAETCWVTSRWR